MKITKILLLALLLQCFAIAGAAPACDKSCCTAQPQADTVSIPAIKMGRDIKAVVTLPRQYFAQDKSQFRFPVLYLLHGASGSYRDWPVKADLNTLASRYGMIIVCPDGQDSWYFDSPIDPTFQFETFISREMVNYIDTHYRTDTRKEMRAITGLSMGGHGALWNAFRHPDVFGSCGSMSGGVDISKFPGRWHIVARLGEYEGNEQVWRSHAVVNLVPTLQPGQNIIIDDGKDDFFYEVNMALHEALVRQGIDHDFTIRPGAHSWDYWLNSLEYHMLFFGKAFERATLP